MDLITIFSILLASLIVTSVSLISAVLLFVPNEKLKAWLPRLVALAVGVLLGDAFLHLIPDALEINNETENNVALWTLVGIVTFFLMESVLHWYHDRDLDNLTETPNVPATFARMNLLGDGAHNFVDGVLITSSFLVAPSLGIATTIAIILHEIPQEISDIGVLIQGGFSKKKAILFNFLCASGCMVGAACTLALSQIMELGLSAMLAFTAGGFIYIAASDLIPLFRSRDVKIGFLGQFSWMLVGILSMQAILWFEHASH